LGDEPGWVCVEVIEQHYRASFREKLRYWWRRLTR
jgi:hypothetical protein